MHACDIYKIGIWYGWRFERKTFSHNGNFTGIQGQVYMHRGSMHH